MWSQWREACGLSGERRVVSVERGVWSQWREACGLSGERRVVSVERGVWSQWREACGLSGERLVCILVTTHVDCLFAAVNVGSY